MVCDRSVIKQIFLYTQNIHTEEARLDDEMDGERDQSRPSNGLQIHSTFQVVYDQFKVDVLLDRKRMNAKTDKNSNTFVVFASNAIHLNYELPKTSIA